MIVFLVLEDAFGEGYYYRGMALTREAAEAILLDQERTDHFKRAYEICEVTL